MGSLRKLKGGPVRAFDVRRQAAHRSVSYPSTMALCWRMVVREAQQGQGASGMLNQLV